MAETKDKIVSLEVLKDVRDTLKAEIDDKIPKEEGKGLSTNDFTDEYKNKVDSALDNYVESDPTVPAWAKEAKKPTYTPEEVGAEASGTVSAHNIAEDAHEDIRGLIADLNDGKVNVADVIDNLVTSATNKPLSAAQGVALKALIDGLSSGKLDSSALASAIDEALAQAKASGEFKGEDGAPGTSVTIVSVSESSEDGGENTVTFSDGSKITIKNGSTGQDGVIGKDGEDGVSPTHSWDGTVLTITSASGTSSADLKGADGQPGADGKDGKDGADGAQGSRGAGIYNITTAPTSYTTTTGGFSPSYRIALSTVLSQGKSTEIIAGDSLRYSYYIYPVGYVDGNYVYLGARVSIRGANGADGDTKFTYGTEDLEAGVSSLATGTLYFVYE